MQSSNAIEDSGLPRSRIFHNMKRSHGGMEILQLASPTFAGGPRGSIAPSVGPLQLLFLQRSRARIVLMVRVS